jgi:hypothetical protein
MAQSLTVPPPSLLDTDALTKAYQQLIALAQSKLEADPSGTWSLTVVNAIASMTEREKILHSKFTTSGTFTSNVQKNLDELLRLYMGSRTSKEQISELLTLYATATTGDGELAGFYVRGVSSMRELSTTAPQTTTPALGEYATELLKSLEAQRFQYTHEFIDSLGFMAEKIQMESNSPRFMRRKAPGTRWESRLAYLKAWLSTMMHRGVITAAEAALVEAVCSFESSEYSQRILSCAEYTYHGHEELWQQDLYLKIMVHLLLHDPSSVVDTELFNALQEQDELVSYPASLSAPFLSTEGKTANYTVTRAVNEYHRVLRVCR